MKGISLPRGIRQEDAHIFLMWTLNASLQSLSYIDMIVQRERLNKGLGFTIFKLI